jgi:hypothetical protein
MLVIAEAGAATIKVPVKLATPGASSATTAFLWFLGLVLPACGAFALQQWTDRRKALHDHYQKGREQWTTVLFAERTRIAEFFNDYYKTLREKKDEEFLMELEKDLQDREWLPRMAEPLRTTLVTAFAKGDRESVVSHLAEAFPEWKSTIVKGN